MLELNYNQSSNKYIDQNIKKKYNLKVLNDKDHWFLDPINYQILKKTKYHSSNYLEKCYICYCFYNKNNLDEWYFFVCNHKTCLICYNNIVNSFNIVKCPYCRIDDINSDIRYDDSDNNSIRINNTNYLRNTNHITRNHITRYRIYINKISSIIKDLLLFFLFIFLLKIFFNKFIFEFYMYISFFNIILVYLIL